MLLVDFRGSGGSSESYTTVGVHEADDVAAAVRYARGKLSHGNVFLFGRSMGAAAILRAVHAHAIGVCREQSVGKLDAFAGRITIVPGATNDRLVIEKAVAGCDGVLTVLVPWGVQHYASGTAQAVLDYAPAGARLLFSCGWHITRDGRDVYSRRFTWSVAAFGWLARFVRVADLKDQVEACRRVSASDTRWTVVRGSDLEEGESQGLPVWSRHVGDPILGGLLFPTLFRHELLRFAHLTTAYISYIKTPPKS